jgi:hypothetical protein
MLLVDFNHDHKERAAGSILNLDLIVLLIRIKDGENGCPKREKLF